MFLKKFKEYTIKVLMKLKKDVYKLTLFKSKDSNSKEFYNMSINFQEDYILIEKDSLYIKKILYTNMSKVWYNIDSEGYWFVFEDITEEALSINQKIIKYRLKNKQKLIEKVKSKKIILIPNFGWSLCGDGIFKYVTMQQKYFLTITTIVWDVCLNQDNVFALNYANIDRKYYKVINSNLKELNLKQELSTTNLNNQFNKKLFNYSIKGVFILDKSLTFGMGYVITFVEIHDSKFPNDPDDCTPNFPSIDIFYSFDEEEIKCKIIEFLSPPYEIVTDTYG